MKDEVGWTCSTHGGNEDNIFVGKPWGRDHLGDLSLEGRTIIIGSEREKDRGYGNVEWIEVAQVGFFEQGDEPLGLSRKT